MTGGRGVDLVLDSVGKATLVDPGFRHSAALKDLLRPFNATLMRRHPVSTRVNFVKNDDPECAAALQAVNAAGATERVRSWPASPGT
jgi:NADPH:quinone reductase-like Zn-dependent oxidoreductase